MTFSRGLYVSIASALTLAVLALPPDAPSAQPRVAARDVHFSDEAISQAQSPQSHGQPQQTPSPQQQTPPSKTPQYSITVQSQLVKIDVVVTDQEGNILTGLTKENFRVTEDNTPQQVTNFTPSDAPITMVMLVEFSNHFGGYMASQGVQWAAPFLEQLKPDDWTALITYDLKSHLVVDFTHDKDEVFNGLRSQMIPAFSEANMFDALIDTLNRLQDVQGKKSILLIGSGADTFSKHTLDQTYKRIKQTDVTIFCVGVGEPFMEYLELHHGLDDNTRIDYLQSKNELTYFSTMSGGYAWFPRFYGEMPAIFNSVAQFLRNQYTLGFAPNGNANDGKYHKVKVEVLGKGGQPLMIPNKKGKMQKAIVYARQGYEAASGTVGD